jgi:hypothetical protein
VTGLPGGSLFPAAQTNFHVPDYLHHACATLLVGSTLVDEASLHSVKTAAAFRIKDLDPSDRITPDVGEIPRIWLTVSLAPQPSRIAFAAPVGAHASLSSDLNPLPNLETRLHEAVSAIWSPWHRGWVWTGVSGEKANDMPTPRF